MNTILNNAQPAAQTNGNAQEGAQENEEFIVKNQYFAPDKMEAAADYVNKVREHCEKEGLKVLSNIPDEGPKEGWGIAVVKQTKRDEAAKKNKLFGVVLACIPDSSTIADHEKGAEFIEGLIQRSNMNRIRQAFSVQDNGAILGVFPEDIDDFIISGRDESLATWNETATEFAKQFRKLGLTGLTAKKLREVLESAEAAEQYYPNIPQDNWQAALDKMIEIVEKNNMDSTVFKHWKKTRDQKHIQAGSFDLDALEALA